MGIINFTFCLGFEKMESTKRSGYKIPHMITLLQVSNNIWDDSDEIIKHKPNANDNIWEISSTSKLHVHLAVPWTQTEAKVVTKCSCKTKLPHGRENGALSGLWKSNCKVRGHCPRPKDPSCRKSLQTASVALSSTHPQAQMFWTTFDSFQSLLPSFQCHTHLSPTPKVGENHPD